MHHTDYEIEPVPGLPEPLPAGETLLWQGTPRWQTLARRVFRVPLVALYFGVLACWRVAAGVADGDAAGSIAVGTAWVLGLGAAAALLLTLIAWMTAKSTMYSITSKRLVLRIGMALPVTINLPFNAIAAAGVRANGDGTGDIVLTLASPHKASYVLLWPHVRPWRFSKAEPMLRGIVQPGVAAQVLSRALAASAGMAVPAMSGVGGPGMADQAADRALHVRRAAA
jgi:hypothetical protein